MYGLSVFDTIAHINYLIRIGCLKREEYKTLLVAKDLLLVSGDEERLTRVIFTCSDSSIDLCIDIGRVADRLNDPILMSLAGVIITYTKGLKIVHVANDKKEKTSGAIDAI